MKGIYLLLGSNLGNSRDMLSIALKQIVLRVGIVVRASSIYKTKAWGIEDQPDFLNQVLEIETEFTPSNTLDELLQIEKDMGRVRYQKWGSRVIDIDILYFGNEIVDSEKLKIPHPENQNRNFVLAPMVEIAPDFIHPILSLSQKELLYKCSDKLAVIKLK